MERSSTEAAYSAALRVEMWRVLREARRISLRARLRVRRLSAMKKREANDALYSFAMRAGPAFHRRRDPGSAQRRGARCSPGNAGGWRCAHHSRLRSRPHLLSRPEGCAASRRAGITSRSLSPSRAAAKPTYVSSRCELGATYSPRFVIPAKAGIRASLRTAIGKFRLTPTQSRAALESSDGSLDGTPPARG